MRRRRRGGGAAPGEACGVWLDTAELKRGPARPLSARLKAPTRAAQGKQSPVLLPQPGTRQTTIPSFFSPPPDETDKENCSPPPCSPAGAWPVKILPLPQLEGAWEEPPGAEQGVQGTAQAWQTPLQPLEPQMEPQRESKASPGAGGHSWGCSPCQSPQHSRDSNKPWIFPGETASGGRKPEPWGRAASGTGSAGTEGTTAAPGAAPRGVCSAQSPLPAQPLRERGQAPAGPCRQLLSQGHRDRARLSPEPLFTQDSEGNRVIKHWW